MLSLDMDPEGLAVCLVANCGHCFVKPSTDCKLCKGLGEVLTANGRAVLELVDRWGQKVYDELNGDPKTAREELAPPASGVNATLEYQRDRIAILNKLLRERQIAMHGVEDRLAASERCISLLNETCAAILKRAEKAEAALEAAREHALLIAGDAANNLLEFLSCYELALSDQDKHHQEHFRKQVFAWAESLREAMVVQPLEAAKPRTALKKDDAPTGYNTILERKILGEIPGAKECLGLLVELAKAVCDVDFKARPTAESNGFDAFERALNARGAVKRELLGVKP